MDGKDVRKLTMKSLRGQIGMVQQDVYLFTGTILENIAYGKPGATREEVVAAARDANAAMSLSCSFQTDTIPISDKEAYQAVRWTKAKIVYCPGVS